MKKIFFLFGFLLFLTACYKSPTDPPDPPVEPVYFHIQVKYERPAGSILLPDQLFKGISVLIFENANCLGDSFYFDLGCFYQERIDDYHFPWSEPLLIPDNLYSMYGLDPARWNGKSDTAVVGDIFTIRVLETGCEKKLTNVVRNSIPCNPYKGPNARMALFRLNPDGTVTNE